MAIMSIKKKDILWVIMLHGGYMNNLKHNVNADYNYCKHKNQSQAKKDIDVSVSSKTSGAASIKEKQIASPRTKMPAPFTYPKRSEVSSKPAHAYAQRSKASQLVKQSDQPKLKDEKKNPQIVTTTKSIPSNNKPIKLVCGDQWWLEYDEYLEKILK